MRLNAAGHWQSFNTAWGLVLRWWSCISASARPDRSLWLSRYAEFAISSGVDLEKARAGAATVGAQLSILSPAQDEKLMREAGFTSIEVFYVGLGFRGWVAHA
jgi:hypothetical protein